MAMITEDLALEKILGAVTPLDPETLPLSAAQGRFAAKELRAGLALPAFDNSSMDGYAVRACDCVPGARLRVSGAQPAGVDLGLRAEVGMAIRIFTGAPIPNGVDAVI